MWRIVNSEVIPDGLADVRYRWSYADLVEAHIMLDAWDAMRPPPPKGGSRG